MDTVRNSDILGTAPMGRLLFRIGGPVMLSMLVQALYNVVDSMFVAAVSESAFNALTMAFPVQGLFGSIGLGLGTGASSVIAKALGSGDDATVRKAAGASAALVLIVWIPFLLFGLFGVKGFFSFLTSNTEISVQGTEYLRIISIFSVAMLGQMMFERHLQASGHSVLSMIAQISGAAFNIVFDPLLIFGWLGFPAMGVRGAAVASVLGQILSFGLALGFCLTRNKEIPITLSEIRLNRRLSGEMIRIGSGTCAMLALSSLMTFGVNKLLIGVSTSATAVFGAYYKLQSLAFIPMQGLGSAIIPVVSYNYGARLGKRIRQAVRISFVFNLSGMALFTLVFLFFPHLLLKMFSANENMMVIGIPAFRIIAVGFVFTGISVASSTVFQVFHRWKLSVLVSVVRLLIPLIPLLAVFLHLGNLTLGWMAFPVSEIIGAVLSATGIAVTFRDTIDRI